MPSYARKYLIPMAPTASSMPSPAAPAGPCSAATMLMTAAATSTGGTGVQQRVRHLAGVFAVEVCAYAIMSNHSHLLPRCRSSLAAEWSAEEVERRWLSVFGRAGGRPAAEDCLRAAGNAGKIGLWRGRLGSVSWFMRCLNEWIARRANAEDDCTGRFWEGRFKCQLLERMELATGNWLATVSGFGGMFHRVAGKPGSLERKARQMNQHWLAGVRASRVVFRRKVAA